MVGIGTDNQAYLKMLDNQGTRPTTNWYSLGGTLIYEPVMASPGGTNYFEIFGIGADRQMYQLSVDCGEWPPKASGWQAAGGCFNSAPTVVIWDTSPVDRSPFRIDVFGLGAKADLWHRVFASGTWITNWETLGGAFDSPVAAVSWAANRIDVFGLGNDDQMFHKWWDGSHWMPSETGWQRLGGVFSSAPVVVSRAPNSLDIFGLGPDAEMYHKGWYGGPDWSPPQMKWESIGGAFKVPRAAQMPSRLDFDAQLVFPDGIAVGGNIHVTLFNDGSATFAGHLHDSGGLAYNVAVACGVIDSHGRAYTFTQAAFVAGTFEPGRRDIDWSEPGNPSPNPSISANWSDFFGCGGAQFRLVANVNVDGFSLLTNLFQGFSEIIEVVSK